MKNNHGLPLEPLDKSSPLYGKVVSYAKERIEAHRLRNDGPHDAIKTADIRGAITALKHLREWLGDVKDGTTDQ